MPGSVLPAAATQQLWPRGGEGIHSLYIPSNVDLVTAHSAWLKRKECVPVAGNEGPPLGSSTRIQVVTGTSKLVW